MGLVIGLPDEMIVQIFEYLDESSLMHSRLVCKGWKRLADDNMLWQELLSKKTPLSFQAPPDENLLAHYVLNRPGASIRHIKSHIGKAYSAWGKVIAVWKAGYGYYNTTLRGTYTQTDHTGSINDFYFYKKGPIPFMATASTDKTIKIWKQILCTERFEIVETLDEHQASVTAISGTSHYLFSGSDDGKIALWIDNYNPIKPSYQLVQHFYAHSKGITVIKPDGTYSFRHLFSGSVDGSIKIWKKRGKTLQWKQTLIGHEGEVTALAYDPYQNMIISSSVDKTIRVWREVGESYSCIAVLQHLERVSDVLFLSGWQRFASASADGVIKIWEEKKGQFEMIKELSLGESVRYATLEHVSAFSCDTVSSLYWVTEKCISIIKMDDVSDRINFPVIPH